MITKTYNSNRTAGLTSQAAVEAIGNRYALILAVSRRTRELSRGDMPRVESGHSPAVTAMLEIEAGKVGMDYVFKETDIDPPRQRRNRNTY